MASDEPCMTTHTSALQPLRSGEESSSVDIVSLAPPPSYAEARGFAPSIITQSEEHRFEKTHRFPSGVFVLRNRSSLKALDVRGGSTLDKTQIIAYNPKRPTLVEGTLFHKGNNQLFFLDWHGCLCAANSSLRVDVDENFELLLSKPQPVLSRPTRTSHPPPQFRYDPLTRTISVVFSYDPTFSDATLEEVNSIEYLLELQTKSSTEYPPCNATALEKLSDWLPFSKPLMANHDGPSGTTEPEYFRHPEDPDQDDSLDPSRTVRVVSVAPGWREKFPTSSSPEARKWLKRQWDIASIVVQPRPLTSQPIASSSTRDTRRSDPDSPPMSVLADLSEALGDLGSEISRALRR